MTTMGAEKGSFASRAQISGPIPAGSPEVTAIVEEIPIAPPSATPRTPGRAAGAATAGRPRRTCARAAPAAPGAVAVLDSCQPNGVPAPGSGDSRKGSLQAG